MRVVAVGAAVVPPALEPVAFGLFTMSGTALGTGGTVVAAPAGGVDVRRPVIATPATPATPVTPAAGAAQDAVGA